MLVKVTLCSPRSPSSSLLPKQNAASQPAPSQCSRPPPVRPGGQPALRPGCAGPASPCTRPGHGKGCSGSWAGPKFLLTVNRWQGKMTFPTRKPLFYVSLFPSALWHLHRHSSFCWIFSSSFKMKE